MEAQEIEKQVLSMSQWMTEISKEIQNRLDADVLAGDVPEEHEVSDCQLNQYFKEYRID